MEGQIKTGMLRRLQRVHTRSIMIAEKKLKGK
jgi:hypothetical protein